MVWVMGVGGEGWPEGGAPGRGAPHCGAAALLRRLPDPCPAPRFHTPFTQGLQTPQNLHTLPHNPGQSTTSACPPLTPPRPQTTSSPAPPPRTPPPSDDDVRLARRIQRDVRERGRGVAGVIEQYTRVRGGREVGAWGWAGGWGQSGWYGGLGWAGAAPCAANQTPLHKLPPPHTHTRTHLNAPPLRPPRNCHPPSL